MNKFKKFVFVILILILWTPVKSYASTNYTTDDLRVLMGMHRLTDDGSFVEIKRLLSTSYKQKEWNELVTALDNLEDIKWNDFKEKEDDWIYAKDILKSNFESNKPIKTILNDYVNYQTAASLRVEYSKESAVDLSLIDSDDIQAKVTYANSILEARNDNSDIGIIGQKMRTFTKDNLLIAIPFGTSYSIDSGKEQINNGLTVSIVQGGKIYSQFNGRVTDVTDNSVIIQTGKSVEIQYIGVQPSVEKKQKIKQFDTIGITKTNNMTVKFRLNTVYVDPLLLYGSRSTSWYEQWICANPGCTLEKNDYSKLLDFLPEELKEKTDDLDYAGTMKNEDGKLEPIIIQGDNRYVDTPENIIIEKTVPGVVIEEKQN